MLRFGGTAVCGGTQLQLPNDLIRNPANRQLGHLETSIECAVIAGIIVAS